MRRAYKFRLYLTRGQDGRAGECLRDHCVLTNAALEERRVAWKRCATSVRYGSQSAQLKAIRQACPEQSRWSFSSQQATLRRLDKSFAAFFRRVKAGQKPGYPRFKSAGRFDSVEWPKDGDGCRWRPDDNRVYLQGIGQLKVHAHRRVEGVVKTITLKREGRRSKNRWRARAKVAEVHRRVRARRSDFHHKTARKLVRTCDTIAFEDLKVARMSRSAAGTLDAPGTNVAAKRGLNRSILDAGWAQFVGILVAKAEEAGRRVVFVDPRHTSINCHRCGQRCTRPEQATVVCPRCGPCDADLNGARNVAARAGLGPGRAAAA